MAVTMGVHKVFWTQQTGQRTTNLWMLKNPLNLRNPGQQVISRVTFLRKYIFDLLIDVLVKVGRKISLNLDIPVDDKISDFFRIKEVSFVHHFLFSFRCGYFYFPCES